MSPTRVVFNHSLSVCVFSKSYVGTKSSTGEVKDVDRLVGDLDRCTEPSEMG